MRSFNKKLNQITFKHRRLISIAGLVLISIHFLMLLFYTLPEGFVPTSLKAHSSKYVTPAFHQQWNLFAPDVEPYDFKIYTRYFDDQWSDWEYPVEIDGVENHRLIPKITRAITHELNSAVHSKDVGIYYVDSVPYFDKVEQSYYYYQAMRYAHRYYAWNGVEDMDSVQIKLKYWISPKPLVTLGYEIKEDSITFKAIEIDGIH